MKNQRMSERLNRIGALVDWSLTVSRLAFLFAGLYLIALLFPFPLAHWYSTPHISFVSISNSTPLAAAGLVLAGLALIAASSLIDESHVKIA
jgi:hypothetical protein